MEVLVEYFTEPVNNTYQERMNKKDKQENTEKTNATEEKVKMWVGLYARKVNMSTVDII